MNELLTPPPGEIRLLHAPPREAMLLLVARMALIGPLLVLDAANEFDAYRVARLIRRRTSRGDPVLGRVHVARAFTCYQVVALLRDLPASTMPHVVFDLPAPFCDERVPLDESRRLLGIALEHVERLRRDAPLIISVRPTAAGRRAGLLQAVVDCADHLFAWDSPAAPAPVRLF
ncbi:MAG: hypothetical protein KA170_10260 [Candidatus Promineofilum sp.]|nr:hypothetical protein [Promineifilum sp.]